MIPLDVMSQTPLLRVRSITNITDERLSPHMRLQMRLQIVDPRERLPTLLTFVVLDAAVKHHMPFQSVFEEKLPTTKRALVVFLAHVSDSLMCVQSIHEIEFLPAAVAFGSLYAVGLLHVERSSVYVDAYKTHVTFTCRFTFLQVDAVVMLMYTPVAVKRLCAFGTVKNGDARPRVNCLRVIIGRFPS